MRILIANDGLRDAGGVETYLSEVAPELAARGHDLALLHCSSAEPQPDPIVDRTTWWSRRTSVAEHGIDRAIGGLAAWSPDVCFSHNMNNLDLERGLLDTAPVVKFMHGYFGTCIGGQKMLQIPGPRPCRRTFSAACLALYLPCGCGQRDPALMLRHYRWAARQQTLFAKYASIVVASEHMRDEYVRNGADASKVHVAPLFARATDRRADATPEHAAAVLFAGRMTSLKGGDLLIRAVAGASRQLGRTISLVMIGDGPQRPRWQQLAADLDVPCRFTGWLTGDALWAEMERATLLAVPSTWPEPFGLVGLEASALGVPAIAFDVGGIREWLRPGDNGYLVRADPPAASEFARVLVSALDDPARPAMRAAARRVACHMSLRRHVDRLVPILMAAATAHRELVEG